MRLICCGVLIGMLTGWAVTRAEPRSSSPEMSEDAELTNVQFLDLRHGWAVGDRGAILRTEDGGRHWQLTDSPVNCRMESIHFIDPMNGWAVGGWIHPLTHRTSAVVLRTDDGGHRWKRLEASTLPALRHVTFFDERNGWAVGNGSAMYPSGLFRTRDGGRSWTAVPADRMGHWLGAHFLDEQTGVVVGRDSVAATVTAGMLRGAERPTADWRPLRNVRFAAGIGWAVGDGGRIWRSSDRGASWFPVNLPAGFTDYFDFRAIGLHGSTIWIGGAPGTRIARSTDSGQTWNVFDTGQPLPLNAMHFVDADHGWAVGALGTLIATQDGGQTWHSQRGDSRRVSLLTIVSEPGRIPLEMLARLGGDEGYLAAVEIINRRDIETPQVLESTAEERSQAAVTSLGGSYTGTAWQFPLRQAGLEMPVESIVGGWNIVNGDQAVARLEELIARKIRQWQPAVVVTESASPDHRDPLAHAINQIVLAAVRLAADPAAFADQQATTHLPPWNVKKVFGRLPAGESGAVQLQTSRLATRLGSSLADEAARARGLLVASWQPSPDQLEFELLINETPKGAGTRDFFSGLLIEPGVARRHATPRTDATLESLTRAARRRRTVDQLLVRNRQDPTEGVSWLAQLDDLTAGLDSNAAGLTLYEVAQSYLAGGNHDLASDVMRSLLSKHPDHPLAEAALLWLVHYHASGEMANRSLAGERSTRAAGASLISRGAGAERRLLHRGNGRINMLENFRLASRQTAGGATPPAALHPDPVPALAQQIRQSRPDLFAEPSIQFALASVHRKQHQTREANHLLASLARSHHADHWSQCARGELWLTNGKGLPPKMMIKCARLREKPRLDGVLDEPGWQDRPAAALRSRLEDDADWSTHVMLAHDDEFLYVGARCGNAPGIDYTTATQPRPRDPDLRHRDRLEILIDIDRDFTTYYHLTIDHRGWVHDACWGDATWNPDWFVAVNSTAEAWTVEAAIPLAELGKGTPERIPTWAVGLQRNVPGVGFQAWTTPAAARPIPAGFGYLQLR